MARHQYCIDKKYDGLQMHEINFTGSDKMKNKLMVLIVYLIAFLFCSVAASTYASEYYGFDNITNNEVVDAAIGEAQLKLVVSESTINSVKNVLFNFTNSGLAASSITDIYFDDDDVPLLHYEKFIQSSGVSYTVGAVPPNLPGGQDPSYHFSSNYSYDSDGPVQPNGINPGESLGILFTFTDGQNYAGLIDALTNENFRVGIHVQGFATGGSESFINKPDAVPEPATLMLLGFGLIGLAGVGRQAEKK